jgi:hypothetical protein
MSNLSLSVDIKSSLQVYSDTSSVTANTPDRVESSFVSKIHTFRRRRTISASGSFTLALATEGLSESAFVRIECLTVGYSFQLLPSGDTTGFTFNPTDTTQKAWFEGPLSFSSIDIVNPDATTDIVIEYSIFEKV